MARHFLAAFALVHGAAALLDGFVDVAVNVDVVFSPDIADVVAQVVNAAASDEDGYDACVTADAAVRSCYLAGSLEATALTAARDCVCCDSKTAIATAYSSCASYISQEQPNARSAYVAASALWSVCSAAGTGICTASRTAAPTTTTTTRASRTATITVPAVCRSMVAIYNPCVDDSDLGSVPDCLCHDSSGKFNTVIEDYASSCAPWARTADVADYSIILRLESVCDSASAATTKSGTKSGLVFTVVSSTDSTSSSQSVPTETSSPTSSATNGAAAGTETTSTSSGLAAPGAALPGFLGWIASLATFVLSFFILI